MSTATKLDIINSTINTLAQAERVTKAALRELSRELLEYVLLNAGKNAQGADMALGDIDAVNRTLAVLTPVNKNVAVLYFRHFLPYSFNEADCTFGKLNKKQKTKKVEQVSEWLNLPENDIWTWSEDNIDVAKKPVDLGADITKAVQRAVKGTEETRSKEATDPLSVAAILDAVIAGGVEPMDLVNMLAQAGEKAA